MTSISDEEGARTAPGAGHFRPFYTSTMSLTIQFHPDWPYRDGTVIEAMVKAGRYRSQFETGISNGGLTAYRGGDRWGWESRLFDGHYDDAPPETRPLYGAWNRKGDVYGGSPRFGSSYLRLRPHVMERATFCFPDSVFEPREFGAAQDLPRLSALADEAAHDYLDDYVEAHIHGGLSFENDVEAIVLDPSHAAGTVARIASDMGCTVEFHPGFHVATLPLDERYRGAESVAVARKLGETINPAVVAKAACAGRYPQRAIKRVWHLLARFGRPHALTRYV